MHLAKTETLFVLCNTILFLLKYKFSFLDKWLPHLKPLHSSLFLQIKRRAYYVDAAQHFIDYMEKYQSKSLFQLASLLHLYTIMCAFKNSPEHKKRLKQIYEKIKTTDHRIQTSTAYNTRSKRHNLLKKNFLFKDAKDCLEVVKSILERHNISFFLVSGTLLGAVREKTFLSHDYDIDLGVILSDFQLEQLALIFQSHPDFSVKRYIPFRLFLTYKNTLAIDIFNHVKINGQYLHGTPDRFWFNQVFDLKTIDFLGTQYNVPADTDLYLQENYGDWRTPQKNYNTLFDTPNILIPRNLFASLFFIQIMYMYMISGEEENLRKVLKYLDELLLRIDEYGLSTDLSFDVPCFDPHRL